MDTDDILEMRNITKKFPGVTALDHIRFDLRKGEIHSLVGENGAGKSTMIKILAGIYLPTEGDVIVDGKKVNIVDANTATTLGISVIHQELSLVPHMTVA
jgi:ribose transport system ATP-binding protein